MKNIIKILILIPSLSFAQRIDNMATFRDIKSDNYFRIHYDNDYFTATDYYYTQGYNFEFTSPRLKSNPLNKLLYSPKSNEKKYGLSIEHMGYTPTSIRFDNILYGDRPFAAAIMLKSFLVATDTVSKSRVGSALNIGIIGPGAFGNEMQTGIHKWVGDIKPLGWHNQIKNDLVLNYEITHEKQLVRPNDFFALNSYEKLKIGTINTNVSAGLTTVFGIINNPFTSVRNKNKFQIYGYLQGLGTLVGYDATLQGGIFNRESPYTIANSDIERVTFQTNFGIIMQYKAVYLEYSRSELSKEFKTGNFHKWGGFRIGFKL